MNAWIAQSRAESLRIVRSPFFLLFSVVMPIIFYALFAMLNGTEMMVGGVTWGSYSLMSMTAFSLIGTAAGQFGIRLSYERKGGLLTVMRLTPMPMSAWIFAKLISHLIIHLFVIVVMFVFSALVFGTSLSAGMWLACGAWLLAGSIPFLGLGILIGTIRSTDIATAVSNIIFMGISVAGGLWMPLETFPEWLQAIGQWMPSYAYANSAWSMLAGGGLAVGDAGLLAGYGFLFLVIAVIVMRRPMQ